MPLEAEIHKKALALYGNICRDNNSVEKHLAERHLHDHATPKSTQCSLFGKINSLLVRFGLGSPHDLSNNMPSKYQWKSAVRKGINHYWKEHILNLASHSSSIKHLRYHCYMPGKRHQLIESVNSSTRDIGRVFVKLKLDTCTYTVQSNRAAFNQTKVDPTCLLCQSGPETKEHFLLHCSYLQAVRSGPNAELCTYRTMSYNS
jgi:hypothetical protein